MKIKAICVFGVVLCTVLIFARWNQAGSARAVPHDFSSPGQPSENARSLPPKPPQPVENRKEEHALNPDFSPARLKEIIQHGNRDGAAKATVTMQEFLKTWDPIGRSAGELKEKFGQPSEEESASIMYIFDNGNNVFVTQFVLKNGKVVSVGHPTERAETN